MGCCASKRQLESNIYTGPDSPPRPVHVLADILAHVPEDPNKPFKESEEAHQEAMEMQRRAMESGEPINIDFQFSRAEKAAMEERERRKKELEAEGKAEDQIEAADQPQGDPGVFVLQPVTYEPLQPPSATATATDAEGNANAGGSVDADHVETISIIETRDGHEPVDDGEQGEGEEEQGQQAEGEQEAKPDKGKGKASSSSGSSSGSSSTSKSRGRTR